MKTQRCVGCTERVPAETAIRVAGLGYVCQTCHEVLPVVWEVEIERVREACRQLEAFLGETP